MVRYVFRDKPNTLKGGAKASPQKIGEALDRIKREAVGRYNSKTILDAARDKKNYLHRFFEWRDTVAAEKYRQEQARELVSIIDIVDESDGEERQLPAFVSLIERDGRQYRTIGEVIDSVELQAIALRQAETDLEAYERRLRMFRDICDALRTAREKVAARRARYDKRKGKGKEDRPSA